MQFDQLNKDQLDRIRHRLLAYSQQVDCFIYLDSCGCSGALNEDSYELLVGIGAQRIIESDDPLVLNTSGRWVFPILSYELKNELERLDSKNPAMIRVSPITLIEPETVLSVNKDMEMRIEGRPLPFDLMQDVREEGEIVYRHSTREGMSKAKYLSRVHSVQHEIREGNVYELNLCYPCEVDAIDPIVPHVLFRSLIEHSPVPYAAFVRFRTTYLICASPERYISRKGTRLLSQPIKGTIRRSRNVAEDNRLKDELLGSEKERAENVMIVDLVRNDLARICRSGTVQVEELFGIYPFAQVFQMISSIRGVLNPGIQLSDIVKASFPMGSMTGAPKIAAMQLIDELEEYSRGWYSGSVGYIKPNGDFDLNVIIRSMIYDASTTKLVYSVGGAITIDSDPEAEWAETRLKASAIETVLNGGVQDSR